MATGNWGDGAAPLRDQPPFFSAEVAPARGAVAADEVKQAAKLALGGTRQRGPGAVKVGGGGKRRRLAARADGAMARERRRLDLLQDRVRENSELELEADRPVLLHLPRSEGKRALDSRPESRVDGKEVDCAA